MNTPLHLWRNFGADRDSKRRFPLVISILAFLFSTFVLTVTLFGQSRTAKPRPTQAQTSASIPAATGGHRDLSASLADLDRVSQATDSDIANLHVDKWGPGWTKTILRSKDQNQQQAQQVAASLQRNLRGAMPGLIHDVQNARGSLSTTFKLYDNLSVVCEALDLLITAAEAKGKKEESAPLNEDYNALIRLRREFSNYIQAGTVALETKGKLPAYTGSTSSGRSGSGSQTVTGPGGVKRIIVDDAIPEKKPAATPVQKKKPAAAAPSSAASELPAPASAPAPVTARAVAPPAPNNAVRSPSATVASAPQSSNTAPVASTSTVSVPAAAPVPVPGSAAAPSPAQMQALVPAPSPSPTPKKKATVIYSN